MIWTIGIVFGIFIFYIFRALNDLDRRLNNLERNMENSELESDDERI